MINKNKNKNKEELAKNRTWKAVGAFDKVCLNCLETKSKSRRRRRRKKEEEDVELNWMFSI